MDKYEVKETFEGFCEINDISGEEEERFKQLIDDMDSLDEGVENVTATEEVRHCIGKVRDMIMDDLDLESDSDEGIAVLSNMNELIKMLRPKQEEMELERMRKEDARAELGL